MVRLTSEQKQFYKDNGYILLKNLISDKELSELVAEYDALFTRKQNEKMESLWVGSDDTFRVHDGPETVKGIHNLQHHHAIFGKFLYNDNLLDAVEDIIGTPNIALHHTKAHFKPPEKGGAYPMHQDYPYFPYKNDSMVAAFIHLDAATPKNGGLLVYPGSHKLGALEDVGAKEGNFHYVDQKKYPIDKATPVIAERGDVVIFSYKLIHGSTPNTSDKPRRMLLVQFKDAEDRPLTETLPEPGYGWLLRGKHVSKNASASSRFDSY